MLKKIISVLNRQSNRPNQLGQSGQVSLMIAMMMVSFILFFAFVINVGVLVNAKINLQNAADLAAYAGAAVQARQLNDISYLNYDMRRAYKKFLFRYYVVGNMFAQTHPTNTTDSAKRFWYHQTNGSTPEGDIPGVCIAFNPGFNNYCQMSELASISIPATNPIDQINETLASTLTSIEKERQKDCLVIGDTNKKVLGLWLWNFDPSTDTFFTQVNALGSDHTKLKTALPKIKGLILGLGLMPRLFIHQMRINTLSDYVNHKPYQAVTYNSLQSIMASGDTAPRERVNNAFLTAWSTLGNHTFADSDSITMDELLPGGSEGSNLLALKSIKTKFDAYATDFKVTDTNLADVTVGTSFGDGIKCTPYLSPQTTKSSVQVGVYKDPKVLTYYAIRLQAKANLLFSPWGAVTLRAYSAAQPFGSRIGPELDSNNWSYPKQAPACAIGAGCAGRIPNLPLSIGESTVSESNGWNLNFVQANFYQRFQPQGQSGQLGSIDGDALNLAYQAAQVPNYPEKGKYNMINDFGSDAFVQNFDPNTTKEKRLHAIWAPLISKDKVASGGTPADVLKKNITDFFSPDTDNPSDTVQSPLTAALFEAASQGYAAKLQQGIGEDGEGYNIARIEDPFMTYPDQGGQPPKLIQFSNPKIMLSDPAEVRSSWSGAKDSNIKTAGRVGYSVKFVPFSLLREPNGVTSNGREVWTNIIPLDALGDADIPKIQH